MIGTKTEHYTDVKMPILAGMKFGTSENKIKIVGYEITRLYFDTAQKDWQVGTEKIKRIINK